eukprot:3895353-Rhodomonas_salina.1
MDPGDAEVEQLVNRLLLLLLLLGAAQALAAPPLAPRLAVGHRRVLHLHGPRRLAPDHLPVDRELADPAHGRGLGDPLPLDAHERAALGRALALRSGPDVRHDAAGLQRP